MYNIYIYIYIYILGWPLTYPVEGGVSTILANFYQFVTLILNIYIYIYIYILEIRPPSGAIISSVSRVGVLGVMVIREEQDLFHPI